MNRPSNVREALLAEALGELAKLLGRVESIAPDLDASTRSAVDAAAHLKAQLDAVPGRTAAANAEALAQAAKYLAQQLNEMSAAAADGQARALGAAARSAVEAELRRAVQQLSGVVDRRMANRCGCTSPWWHHAITALLAGGATWLLALLLLSH